MFVVLADYTFKRSARTRLCQAGDAQTLGSKDRAGRSRNMQEEPRRNTPFFTTLQTTRMVQGECFNQLLQWGIENSAAPNNDTTAQPAEQQRDPSRGLNPEILAQLLGGPSDADRMREAMTAILAPVAEVDMDNKMIAWDNLEQLIESIDNANNLEPLGMWTPLVQQLGSEEAGSRMMAAWCCSTAVQNNIKSQEKLVSYGAVPKLAGLVLEDRDQGVRKRACNALSSATRNFQPAMDELEKSLPEGVWKVKGLDAADMESVDEVIEKLREIAAGGPTA
ncbi:hsp70 nucleotide exchange factor fes1 [Friedmanniomyces endolithicus]|nr:hsp70 nucleotide exchange factor fes1 [Friedmanniomyces endolithicus]